MTDTNKPKLTLVAKDPPADRITQQMDKLREAGIDPHTGKPLDGCTTTGCGCDPAPAPTNPGTDLAPAPASTDPNHVSTHAERMAWPRERALQLQRMHHKFQGVNESGLRELMSILTALGVAKEDGSRGPFCEAMDSSVGIAHPDIGTLMLDISHSGCRVEGKRVGFLEVYASGDHTFDMRILSNPKAHDATTVPDARWAGGAEVLAVVKDQPVAWLLASAEKMLGTSLRKPMSGIRFLRSVLDQATDEFTGCDCDECKKAVANAKANGTDVVTEKIALAPGQYPELTKLLERHKTIEAALSEPKAQEAAERSFLHDAPATVH